MKKDLCGIYKITCVVNGKCYIGQSVDIKRRWRTHKYKLKQRTHFNQYLQNLYNKYGGKNLTFEIIELCSKELLDERERYWIKYYGGVESKKNCNWESGGNSQKTCSSLTRKRLIESHLGFKVAEETKRKISNSTKGKRLGKERYNSKSVLKINKQGIVVKKYESLNEAGQDCGIAYTSIRKRTKHSDRLYDNHYWKLLEE